MAGKDNTQQPKETKAFPVEVIGIDEEQGIVKAIVSVFGNIDNGDDRIHPGAFVKTITERLGKIRVLDNHNNRSTTDVVGKPILIREVMRDELPEQTKMNYPEATGGLYTETQYDLEDERSRGVFRRIKNGFINEYSIGYDPFDEDYETIKNGYGQRQIRNIRTIRLWEYSPVIWGMNPATVTVDAKAANGAGDLPLADRAREWDGTAAERRVREWAGGADNMDWPKYRKAFFWYDGENAEQFGGYKLGFADVIDGTLTAIPRGIFAVAAVLQGSRGGVNIPDSDKEAVRRSVDRWYAKMRTEFDDDSIVTPWNKADDAEPDTKTDDPTPVVIVDVPDEEKAGRMLSAATAERIRRVMDELHQLLADAGLMMDDEEGDDSEMMSDAQTKGQELPANASEAGPQAAPTDVETQRTLIDIEQSLLENKRLQWSLHHPQED